MPSASPQRAAARRTGLCLSVQQPWAWLIVNGFKDIENRDWPTKVRGIVGVHAGKKHDHEADAFIRRQFPLIDLPHYCDMDHGGVVGRVEIVDCVQDSDSEWFFGKFGFVLRNAEPLPFMPCRGLLGFFKPTFTTDGAHV